MRSDASRSSDGGADDGANADSSSPHGTLAAHPTAQNAVETAALRAVRNRSDRSPAAGTLTEPAATAAAEPAAEPHHDDDTTNTMTEECEELIDVRDSLDAKLSDIGDTIEERHDDVGALEDDLAAAVAARDSATTSFLPDDAVPASVSTERRDAIESHLGVLMEERDVRSEDVAMSGEAKDLETKNAADARDDIDEISVVVDRLEGWAEEAEAAVDQARADLDAAQSRFSDDLVLLAAQLAAYDIELTDERLGTVIEDRIPERRAAMMATIESATVRVAELGTRASELAAEREALRSIEGGGTCPTCNQPVGSERTQDELDAVEQELEEVNRRLGVAKRERDELVARREELADLRDEAIALQAFRSETVAGARGRLADREESLADLRADLEEEQAGLAAAQRERDRADAAITRLEAELEDLETEIDRLEAAAAAGEFSMDAFGVVDDLRASLEEVGGSLAGLQATYDELETERAAIDDEIEALSDAE